MLAPGERDEIWKDFSALNAESEIQLQSLAFNDGTSMGMDGGMMGRGMMGGMMQPGGVENGVAFQIASFKVTENNGKKLELPSIL